MDWRIVVKEIQDVPNFPNRELGGQHESTNDQDQDQCRRDQEK